MALADERRAQPVLTAMRCAAPAIPVEAKPRRFALRTRGTASLPAVAVVALFDATTKPLRASVPAKASRSIEDCTVPPPHSYAAVSDLPLPVATASAVGPRSIVRHAHQYVSPAMSLTHKLVHRNPKMERVTRNSSASSGFPSRPSLGEDPLLRQVTHGQQGGAATSLSSLKNWKGFLRRLAELL